MARRKKAPRQITQGADDSPPAQARLWPVVPVWAAALLVFVVAGAAYLGVSGGAFVWDDQTLLVEWPGYRDASLLGAAAAGNVPFSPNYFRPLAALTFYASFALHGLLPMGYRLANVLIHALSALIAYVLLRRWLRPTAQGGEQAGSSSTKGVLSEWLALGLALLFAWHPVHVESVAFAVGRFDLLSGLFVLLAFLLGTWPARSRPGQSLLAAGTGLAFLLALGCKEMAITFPFLLLALDLFRGVRWRDRWPLYVALGLALLTYIALRVWGLGYLFQAQPQVALPAGNLLQHLLLIGRSAVDYIVLLVWPYGTLAPLHPTSLPVAMSDALAWVQLGIVVALLALLAWALLRRWRAGWLWLGFLLSLAPVLNVLPLELRGGTIVAERYLYLPSFLFIAALGASLLALWGRWQRRPGAEKGRVLPVAGAAVGLLVLAASLATTLVAIPHWATDESLWTWAAERAPESSLPYSNLSQVALTEGDWEKALENANRATALNAEDATAHNNAGSALLSGGRAAEAETAFRQAIAYQPESPLYWTNLAAAVATQGRLQEASTMVETEVLGRDSSFGAGYALLGALYVNLDEPGKAVTALEQAQRYLPNPDVVRNSLVEALLSAGQTERALDLAADGENPLSASRWLELGSQIAAGGQPELAIRAYDLALEANSRSGQLDRSEQVLLQVWRSAAYQALGDLDKAEEVAFQAMMIDPGEPLVHKAMGDLLRARGSLAAAQKSYERAQSLAPSVASLNFDLGEVLWEQGKHDEARQKFNLYLEMAPQGPYAERAQAYLER